ncbi:fluoride efflux transporter FluC [Oceanobacillus halotolerans]|uniref:fluoride efflux transporter FluC n=1 Tax=Oceanobacillus halotolerans TaxID=2663380 RepID=UPI0013DBD146|nr:CrcB family protein [Oceanobacillus halotolerans]
MSFLYVALGGFVGSILRGYIAIKFNKRLIGTWIANVSGSIMLAFLLHYYRIDILPSELWFVFGIGFCGAYTTFSTFGHETLQLLINEEFRSAIFYVISSFLISISSVILILLLLSN